MRIIAGAWKGRRIEAPDWPGLRPTSDRLRETLFNVLAQRMAGARLLDGYAGTGAVGIEALSRGAAHVTFVERDPRALRLVAANLRRCGAEDRHAIIRLDFTAAATAVTAERFDIVFLDPPYGAAELHAALAGAAAYAAPDTVTIVEHARRDQPPAETATLRLTRDLASGDSALAFYRTIT